MRPWLFSVFALCLWTTVAHASPRPSGDPVSMVREATTRITTIASEATEQAALTADIETVMDGLVDFEGFSARTLKSQWKPLSASKRRRFVTAFRALVMRTYGKRFKPGATFRVTYRGDTTFGDGPTALVSTTIHGDKAAADVDYLFAPTQVGKALVWRAVDIVVDEVSMARNWRTQFLRILKRDGYETLISKIEKKTQKR